MSRRWTWTLLAASVVLVSDRSLVMASSPLKADFDGDGWADLAIGVSREDVSGVADAGVVHVLYGSGNGFPTFGFFRQGIGGVPDQAEPYDRFGDSLAAGDFNGDGWADLAIGAPGEDINSVDGAGSVIVLYGSYSGLTSAGADRWYQGDICWFAGQINGQPGTSDSFGSTLAAGDFDGDGYDDLAIGVPGETADAGNVFQAGAVNVIYGSSVGLNCPGDQLWYQGSPGIVGAPATTDNFGAALAAGDFDNDSHDDLAVGVPFEDINGVSDAGAVNIIRGSGSGLIGANDPVWHQDYGSVQGVGGTYDIFGWSLAAGKFNMDGMDDLAIGIPLDDVLGLTDAGSVTVLYGSGGGLTDSGNQLWSQGVLGEIHASEHFGWSLAVGNFGNGVFDDLAVGIGLDEVSGIAAAGSVNVIYGSASGLTAAGDQVWNQASAGVAGGPEQGDHFGGAVAAGDFNGDGLADLAVAAAQEDFGGVVDAGVVHVLYASSGGGGLSGSGSLLLDQSLIGEQGEAYDWFGSLAR